VPEEEFQLAMRSHTDEAVSDQILEVVAKHGDGLVRTGWLAPGGAGSG
jgi:hypothetical protein